MKKNEDEITELFRSRLEKYEIPLQEDMWEDLEKEFRISSVASETVRLIHLHLSSLKMNSPNCFARD